MCPLATGRYLGVSLRLRPVLGTRDGVPCQGSKTHGENLKELALMAEAGMAPEDVILATTRSAAELMGLDEELGSIEPGKRADLVVVDGDPFELKTLDQRIEAVYKDGERVVG